MDKNFKEKITKDFKELYNYVDGKKYDDALALENLCVDYDDGELFDGCYGYRGDTEVGEYSYFAYTVHNSNGIAMLSQFVDVYDINNTELIQNYFIEI